MERCPQILNNLRKLLNSMDVCVHMCFTHTCTVYNMHGFIHMHTHVQMHMHTDINKCICACVYTDILYLPKMFCKYASFY